MMKFKSNKQFFWRLNVLSKKGAKVKPKLQPSAEYIAERNRIELAVNRRVFWELGKEGYAKWRKLGYKDYGTLARAYGIK
tara:strand:- start:345 stop:584 length:240 start_codon:yes stop_codon:yes gene_type:complete